jgi:hypothetical protein
MIVTGGPRRNRGRVGVLRQFCNDWFSVELPPDDTHPAMDAVILAPPMVRLTAAEVQRLQDAYETAGTLWQEFALEGPAPDGFYRFKRVARILSGRTGRHRPRDKT